MTAKIPPSDTRIDIEPTGAEVAAHAILELAATHPGQFGRLRTARLVGGYAVSLDDDTETSTAPYTRAVRHWTLGDLVALVDALLAGGLLAQTTRQRPTLALTRAGHRALDALEGERRALATCP